MRPIFILFLLVPTIVGLDSESSKGNFSKEQLIALSLEILNHTPEYLHFVEGKKFSWVLVEMKENDPFPELTISVLTLLKKKYNVYRSEDEIPADNILKEGSFTTYFDGFMFRFEIKKLDENVVQVKYSDYESPLAASSQTIKYLWEKDKWIVLEKSHLIVA